jgi:hypothetical protein
VERTVRKLTVLVDYYLISVMFEFFNDVLFDEFCFFGMEDVGGFSHPDKSFSFFCCKKVVIFFNRLPV